MNSEKRFGQIEEVLAEALIKIDRIEDVATKTFSLAETAKTNVETTARAVASLTIENQQAHQQMSDKLDAVASLTVENQQTHQQMSDKLDAVKDDVKEIMNFLREKFS